MEGSTQSSSALWQWHPDHGLVSDAALHILWQTGLSEQLEDMSLSTQGHILVLPQEGRKGFGTCGMTGNVRRGSLEGRLFIYIFIIILKKFYFWLRWVFIAVCRLSLVVVSRGYSSLRWEGFSLWWLLLLRSAGSRRAGFSSCGTQAQ